MSKGNRQSRYRFFLFLISFFDSFISVFPLPFLGSWFPYKLFFFLRALHLSFVIFVSSYKGVPQVKSKYVCMFRTRSIIMSGEDGEMLSDVIAQIKDKIVVVINLTVVAREH